MQVVNKIGHFSEKKEKIRFETSLEKEIHKMVSNIRYGEKIEIPVLSATMDGVKEVIKIIENSAFYNNINLHKKMAKDMSFITIKVDW
jgi:hypothetical protein